MRSIYQNLEFPINQDCDLIHSHADRYALCAFSPIIFSQGVLTVWEETPEVKKTSRGHQRQVFLFQECIVLCKLKRDTGVSSDTYAFRNKMKVGFKGPTFSPYQSSDSRGEASNDSSWPPKTINLCCMCVCGEVFSPLSERRLKADKKAEEMEN